MDNKYYDKSMFDELAEYEGRNWWFQSRNKIILWAIKKFANDFEKMLEVGCGTGFVLDAIHKEYKNASLVGTEYYEEGLVYAKQRVPLAKFTQLDATTMKDSEVYDIVGAFDVLEHIDDDVKVISNLSCAIKKQGYLIITVPQHKWLWSSSDEAACHVRRYDRNDLISKIHKTGMEVKLITSFVSILLPLMALSRFKMKLNNKRTDPMSEFKIARWLNLVLEVVMNLEIFMLRNGIRMPCGGSLLLVAKKI